eukprot:GFYU01015223.1.p1 GENE.GFYU01015223.1~~GFYU01015223.1.p1  ORF type:complete len:237 (+),score=66.26 GFYU01015223.1:2-712(+)
MVALLYPTIPVWKAVRTHNEDLMKDPVRKIQFGLLMAPFKDTATGFFMLQHFSSLSIAFARFFDGRKEIQIIGLVTFALFEMGMYIRYKPFKDNKNLYLAVMLATNNLLFLGSSYLSSALGVVSIPFQASFIVAGLTGFAIVGGMVYLMKKRIEALKATPRSFPSPVGVFLATLRRDARESLYMTYLGSGLAKTRQADDVVFPQIVLNVLSSSSSESDSDSDSCDDDTTMASTDTE